MKKEKGQIEGKLADDMVHLFFQTFTRQFTHKTSLLPNNLHNFFADRTVHTTKAEEFWDAGIVVIPRCDGFIVWKRM